ncbi:MAG TPA: AAA family ATPase, partial [Thermoanaerobaculia bacterium]|nr:AAA family ATPase [Thermoanaerobaculia bacterium]
QIVGALRRALPAMQFLATTHDPLCLRGLGNGEVAVLRRADDGQVISVTGLPSPADFRVDQLLTSDFFGLNSTVDPDVEAIFDEYYALLALKAPTPEQEARLTELRKELDGRRHLGTTLRENLMYEAVDRLVAQHRVAPTVPLAELQQQAVLEVAKIWNEAPGKAAS